MTWDNERDLLGLDLDDVLEGYDVDFVIEPRNVLLDPDVRARLDEANPERESPPVESWSTRSRIYSEMPTQNSEAIE